MRGRDGDCSRLREWNGSRGVMVNNRDGLFMTPRATRAALSFSLLPFPPPSAVCSVSMRILVAIIAPALSR